MGLELGLGLGLGLGLESEEESLDHKEHEEERRRRERGATLAPLDKGGVSVEDVLENHRGTQAQE